MSFYNHQGDDHNMAAHSVNPALTFQHSGQTFDQLSLQPTVEPSGNNQVTHPAKSTSATPVYHTTTMNNSHDEAGHHFSGQAQNAMIPANNNVSDNCGQHFSGHSHTATALNNDSSNYSYGYGLHSAQPSASLGATNAARDMVSSSPANSIVNSYSQYQSNAQNNSFASQQPDFQTLATMNNMSYYTQQPVFMPQYGYGMMPFHYGQNFNMYGQPFTTPMLSVMEPPIQTITMGPPSTIVSSIENWRHHVDSPAVESTTTGRSAAQHNVSPQFGYDNSSFNPAVLATFNPPVINRKSNDVKPAMKRRKKGRSCFVCNGLNNDDMIHCAHPNHKGATRFHLDCAGLSSATDNVGSWVCNTCLSIDPAQFPSPSSAPAPSPPPESDHSSYHPSPPKKKKVMRKSRKIYHAPAGHNPVNDLFQPYAKSTQSAPYQPPSSATRSGFVPLSVPPPPENVTHPNPHGRGLTSHGGWTTAEDEAAISVLTVLIRQRTSNELKVPIDKMWELAAQRMATLGFDRSASGIKMQWTRRLRAKCGLDERKVPNAAMMRTGLILRRGDRRRADESDEEETVVDRRGRARTVAPSSSKKAATGGRAWKGGLVPGRVSKKKCTGTSSSIATASPALTVRGRQTKRLPDVKPQRSSRVDEGIAMLPDNSFVTMVRDTEQGMDVDEKQYDDEESEQSRGSSHFEDALEDTLMG